MSADILTHPITLILSLGCLRRGARHWSWRWKTTKRKRRQCCVSTVRRSPFSSPLKRA